MTGFYVGDPITQYTKLSKLAFKLRFTQTERTTIRAASSTDPVVFDIQDLIDSAEYVDVRRKETIDSVLYLESVGLLEFVGRSAIILSNHLEEHEKFKG